MYGPPKAYSVYKCMCKGYSNINGESHSQSTLKGLFTNFEFILVKVLFIPVDISACLSVNN